MHKENISHNQQKTNKNYQHARLYSYDLLQFNQMKRLVSIKIYTWMVFHAKIIHQDEHKVVRKTGFQTNNISQKTLENKIGRGRSVIQSGISELKDLGLLTVKQRLGNPAIYILTTPKHTVSSALESKTPSDLESKSSKHIESNTPSDRKSKTLSDRKSRQETNYNKSNTNNIHRTDNEFDYLFKD